MRQEAAAHVARAVTTRGGTGHAVRLPGLPRELRAIHVAVLLPLSGQRASRSAAVRCVLSSHVTLPITPGYWTPAARGSAGCHQNSM